MKTLGNVQLPIKEVIIVNPDDHENNYNIILDFDNIDLLDTLSNIPEGHNCRIVIKSEKVRAILLIYVNHQAKNKYRIYLAPSYDFMMSRIAEMLNNCDDKQIRKHWSDVQDFLYRHKQELLFDNK